MSQSSAFGFAKGKILPFAGFPDLQRVKILQPKGKKKITGVASSHSIGQSHQASHLDWRPRITRNPKTSAFLSF